MIYIYMGYTYIYTRDAGPHNATNPPSHTAAVLVWPHSQQIPSRPTCPPWLAAKARLHPGWAKCEKRLNTPNNKEKEIRQPPLNVPGWMFCRATPLNVPLDGCWKMAFYIEISGLFQMIIQQMFLKNKEF